MEVSDLLDEMPEDKPYDVLKEAIIHRAGESGERPLHHLFNNLPLE